MILIYKCMMFIKQEEVFAHSNCYISILLLVFEGS